MRDDLLDACASVDWAIAQLPIFSRRIDSWFHDNVHVSVEDLPSPATHNVVVATKKAPFPLAFNVEFGAYVNAIRSSLDLLASALSARNRISDNPEAHFPIYRSQNDFLDPKDGLEAIKWLSKTEIEIIKSLQPYRGGNDALWILHQLDIMRKHRRLLRVQMAPLDLLVAGTAELPKGFITIKNATGWFEIGTDKTVLGLLGKGGPHYEMKVTFQIALDETGPIGGKPAIAAIYHLTDSVRRIIGLFEAT